jgi:PAS domain S-box-containing protein
MNSGLLPEARAAAEAVAEFDRDFVDFFDNAAVPMHWVNRAGIIVRANQAELALLGYQPEDYLGRNIAEFHADADAIRNVLERLENGETLREYPARLRCKDGSLKDVRITSNVKWENGVFMHTRCLTRDISAEQRTEELGRQATDYLEGLLEGFVAYDAQWRMTYMNAAAERILNQRRADVLGKTWHEAYPHAVGNAVDTMYRRVMHSRVAETMELFYEHYGRWFEIAASPVTNGGVAVCFRDVSEPRRRDETRNRLAAIVESSDDAIISKSLDGIIQSWNRGAERIFGFSEEEAVGRPITIIIPDDRLDEEKDFLARLRRGERIEHYETVRRAKDGRLIDVSLTISPVRDGEGRIVGASKVGRDISARKRDEAALRDADRRKDDFLAMLSHELRNPLAPIRNSLHLLRMAEPGGEDAARARTIIERQVNNMVRLVDDLLEVSRISRGKIDLRKEPVELSSAVLSAVETSRPVIEGAHHRFAIDLAAESLVVNGDFVRLGQVMSNLLNNAAKYTPDGGSIALAVRREGAYAVVEVRDSGIGLQAEMLERVFEMFFQAQGPAASPGGGLGIGLGLARNIVELHGGEIRAASEGLGKGSVFTVRLPLASSQPRKRPANAQEGWGRPGRNGPRRILVVDDNVDAAESLGLMLGNMGHHVQIAHDGRAALEAARETVPEIVLLDISMPGFDGHEVVRRLRQDPVFQKVRFAAITGLGRPEDVRKSREAGFDEHLVKPVSPEVLQLMLQR